MEGAMTDHYLAEFKRQQENLHTLFARVEAANQAARTHLCHSASSKSLGSDNGDDIVEPLPSTCLDEIAQSVSSKASTWTDLRKQYPPSQSCFAPVSATASSKDATTNMGVAELETYLSTDSV
ncbi:hypothetical protein GGI10_002507 [Coemansia sp. RSA 2530]|nr:hypothetical protein GGI10_002507 [Coemansia sp. RSA 2530]